MATTTLSNDDLVLDHELADVASSIRFLLDVTPVNLADARDAFLTNRREPEFVYSPLRDDPEVTEARLAALSLDGVEDETLLHLLNGKRRELQFQLQMLRCRGTDEFRQLSEQLYGPVTPALLGEAESLLALVTPPAPEHDRVLDAEAFARAANDELDRYRAVEPDIDAHVEVRSDSTGVMVSQGTLLIAPTVLVHEDRVDALLAHEVGTHVVTYVNGFHQPLRLLGAGLADYDETQEGLAVFAEYLVGGLTARRLRQLAARVVAVHRMLEGGEFAEVHHDLVESGVSSREAFTITMRVFRSGGLTKDAVYLRGLRGVVSHVGAGGSLDVLWLGKMSLADLPRIELLRERDVLVDPLLVPRHLAGSEAKERLARITPTTLLTDLTEEAA